MADANHAPYFGRLHFTARGKYQGGWSARFNDRYQWWQVDLGKPAKVRSVLTQGRQNANQWVTQYRLSSSQDGLSWADYKVQDSIKVRACFIQQFLMLKRACIELKKKAKQTNKQTKNHTLRKFKEHERIETRNP